jgi:DNA-directed RNA polymerase subunit L
MELDVENTDNEERIVTTGDFILTNKETGNKVSKTDTDKIFPKNSITGDYITFLRLRPKLSETIPGQSIKLKCGFAVFTAKDDSVYIPVSKCTYFNTVDKKEAEKAWLIYKTDFSKQFDNSGDSKKEINEELKFEKKNFDALEMYRHFEKDSFDFTVKTTSFYTESQLVHKGCSLLIERLERFINNILKIDGLDDDDDDNNGTNNGTNDNKHAEPMVKIKLSHEVLEHPSSMENSFDIIMVGEDYTLGNILQHLVYDMFYIGDKSVIYCGFQKYHPHDLHSVLRVAYTKPTTTETLVDDLKKCVKRGVDIFGKIQKVIGGGK